MSKIIGRVQEKKLLTQALTSEVSEFVAVTGRRRVGKTYLIDQLYTGHYCFTLTGVQNGNLAIQLALFSAQLAKYDGTGNQQQFINWLEAFQALEVYAESLPKDAKQVIFLDELPWIATPRSEFLTFLGHFWNSYLSKHTHFVLVICGSATSWIVEKVLANAGGLHNRVTCRIHLYPFTLGEANAFLTAKKIHLSPDDLARTYMMLGGIPFYLNQLQRGDSVATGIERICFSPAGQLRREYENLYRALFRGGDKHIAVVNALAAKPEGLNRKEILAAVPNLSVGTYAKVIDELEVSDFIRRDVPYRRRKRGTLYRLIDEYSIFYHRFIKPMRQHTPGIWVQQASTQTYRIWSGHAFEVLCHKHIPAIKAALGITSVFTEAYRLRLAQADGQPGTQIDLLLDRADNVVNLCEIKFHRTGIRVDRVLEQNLTHKRERLLQLLPNTKRVIVTAITNHPLLDRWEESVVDVNVTLEEMLNEM